MAKKKSSGKGSGKGNNNNNNGNNNGRKNQTQNHNQNQKQKQQQQQQQLELEQQKLQQLQLQHQQQRQQQQLGTTGESGIGQVELISLRAQQQSNEVTRQMALSKVEAARSEQHMALHTFNAEQQMEQQRQLDFLIQQQRLQLEKQLMEFNKLSTDLQQESKLDEYQKQTAIDGMEMQAQVHQPVRHDAPINPKYNVVNPDLRSVPRGGGPRSSKSNFDVRSLHSRASHTHSMISTSESTTRTRRSSKEGDRLVSIRMQQAQARLAQQEAALAKTTRTPRRLSQQALQASHQLTPDDKAKVRVVDSNGVWITPGGVLTSEGKFAA